MTVFSSSTSFCSWALDDRNCDAALCNCVMPVCSWDIAVDWCVTDVCRRDRQTCLRLWLSSTWLHMDTVLSNCDTRVVSWSSICSVWALLWDTTDCPELIENLIIIWRSSNVAVGVSWSVRLLRLALFCSMICRRKKTVIPTDPSLALCEHCPVTRLSWAHWTVGWCECCSAM